MSDNRDYALSPAYAGPAFYNAPSPSSLPIPRFAKRSSTVSGVSSLSTLGGRKSPLDSIDHIKQASSDSETSSIKRKSVSFTSDTKTYDGKRAILAIMEQDKSIDMKSKTTLMAPAQRNAGFEKLAKRIREDNEDQASRERVQHQGSEILELRKCQLTIVNHIEKESTEVTIQYTSQKMIDIRDQQFTIPANVQPQTRSMQQIWTNQQIQKVWQHATETLVMLERSNNHLLQLANQRLGQNPARQQEILQQRLDEINEKINRERGSLADDEMGLTSSSDEDNLTSTDDEANLVNGEVDRDEYHHREVILPSNLSLVANPLETICEESEETAVVYGNEADRGTPEAEENEETKEEAKEDEDIEEEAEDWTDFEDSEDEGYYSAEEMVEEQDDEGYYSMEEEEQ